jgi:hypothetical protein
VATPPPARPPADKIELYDRLVATEPRAERKGASMPYTSVNGHMYSYLSPEGRLALRLPDDLRQTFLTTYDAKLREVHGHVQVEYVDVPDALLAATEELQTFFAASLAYVSSLKPKPTTRKKPKLPGKPEA